MCGKDFSIYGIQLENVLNLFIFILCPVLHSKLQVQLFENLFPPRARNKAVEETIICFIKIQSENMKMAWNISLFIFCMVYNFSKYDGLTVL